MLVFHEIFKQKGDFLAADSAKAPCKRSQGFHEMNGICGFRPLEAAADSEDDT
jgi:hypothetical protein